MQVAVSATDQIIGTGDGSEMAFQLIKTYGSGGHSSVRKIKKPVAGTVRLALDAVEQMSGWSVDTTTGMVTFTALRRRCRHRGRLRVRCAGPLRHRRARRLLGQRQHTQRAQPIVEIRV
jgi:hypothetical protein